MPDSTEALVALFAIVVTSLKVTVTDAIDSLIGADLAISTLSVGPHTITAKYNGSNPNFNASTTVSLIETLQRAAAIRPGEELASEFAAALARPDLRAVGAAWRFERVTDADMPEFSPDLAQCAVPEKTGGFSLRDSGLEIDVPHGRDRKSVV